MNTPRCTRCGKALTPEELLLPTANGERRRRRPVCRECHEQAVRGLVGVVRHRPGKMQRWTGAAKKEYDGS